MKDRRRLNRVNIVDVATDVVEGSSGVGTISVAPHPLVQVPWQLVCRDAFHRLELVLRLSPVRLDSLRMDACHGINTILTVVDSGISVVDVCAELPVSSPLIAVDNRTVANHPLDASDELNVLVHPSNRPSVCPCRYSPRSLSSLASRSLYFRRCGGCGAPVSARASVKSFVTCSVFHTVRSWYVLGCEQPIALFRRMCQPSMALFVLVAAVWTFHIRGGKSHPTTCPRSSWVGTLPPHSGVTGHLPPSSRTLAALWW